MLNPEKPKLAPDLQIYEKGYFKKTDKEFKEETEDIKKKRIMEEGRKKVEEAVEKGEIKFGTEQEKISKKPSFEEFKAQQESEFQKKVEEKEKIREAEKKLEEEYKEAER